MIQNLARRGGRIPDDGVPTLSPLIPFLRLAIDQPRSPQELDENCECYDGQMCTWDQFLDGACTHTANTYGDVDMFDLCYILNGFAGNDPFCSGLPQGSVTFAKGRARQGA